MCNCTLQSNLTYLPRDLGSCNNNFTHINFTHKPNAAFSTIFGDFLKSQPLPPHLPSDLPLPPSSKTFDFPVNIPENISSSINSLRSLHTQMLRNLSSFSNTSRDRPSIDELMSLYNAKISQNLSSLQTEIYARHEDSFLSSPNIAAMSIISLLISMITCIYLAHFAIDYRKTKMLLRIDQDKAKKLLATATLLETVNETQAYLVSRTGPPFSTHPLS